MAEPAYCIGLISGTSVDGVDAALLRLHPTPTLVAHHSQPIPESLRQQVLDLCQPGADEIERLGRLDRELGLLFAEAAQAVRAAGQVAPAQILAIGSHGQTVRHRPPQPAETQPFSLQIADPNTIAEATGITVVADFRRRDIAAGGQAAPLVPAFHRAVFADPEQERAVVNIGGFGNITHLPRRGPVIGFDTGPGNTLLDAWIAEQRGEAFDRDGAWAASGQARGALLTRLLAAPFFQRPAPKSTGREDFHLAWLQQQLQDQTLPAADVQATLCEFSAVTIARELLALTPAPERVLICGGGARNDELMRRLRAHLPGMAVALTDEVGIAAEWVEACAFAWLAAQTLAGLPGNVPTVTGAAGPRVLGGIYPA